MFELHVSDIKVIKEDLSLVDTGGGFRVVTSEIHIDKTLPRERQIESLLYEILGTYFGSFISCEVLDEVANKMYIALEELLNEPKN